MTSKAVTPKIEGSEPEEKWQPLREFAPSVMRDEPPTVARWVGLIGLLVATLGVVAIVFNQAGWSSRIGGSVASVLAALGFAGLLYHAAIDDDLQIRRAYGIWGFVLIGVGVLCGLWPLQGVVGGAFLPWGFYSLAGGLMFLLPFIRNETDPLWKSRSIGVIGVLGVGLAAIGLIGGTYSIPFLLPYGLLVSILGLAYLWAYIGLMGISNDFTYRVGVGMGGAGGLALLIALGRSLPQLLNGLGMWARVPEPRYFQTAGLLMALVGGVYVLVSLLLTSDRQFIVLTRRELSAFFYSPMAYFILFGFAFIAWIQFLMFVNNVRQAAENGVPLVEPIIQYYMFALFPVICLLLVVPLLTMRLLSEEGRTQTLEVLLTAPVKETPIVVSKWLATLIVFVLTWVPYGLFLISLRMETGQTFDYGPIISFSIALVCCGASFTSMGLFFSSWTRNQLVAGVLTAMAMMVMMAVYFIRAWFVQPGNAWFPIMQYFSFIDLWDMTLKGRMALRELMLYISMTVFWLYLTVKVLESRKWR